MDDRIARKSAEMRSLHAFLDWLVTQSGLDLCRQHEHGDACRGAGGAIECGMAIGSLEALSVEGVMGLPAQYLEIDFAEQRRELDALGAWMEKGRPGGRAA
jgi:hypothetical protein